MARWCFLPLFALFCGFGLVQCELKSVVIAFRHGERTPAMSLGHFGQSQLLTDLGPGQLTPNGSKQMYEVGVDLRSRYLELLHPSGYFRSSNMEVISSSKERCIASLTSFMAGFLPPPASDDTIPFPWQSFPFSVDNDGSLIKTDFKVCPAMDLDSDRRLEELERNPKVLAWLREDSNTLKRIGEYVGENVTSLYGGFLAVEMIRTQRHLEELPAWLISAYGQLQRYSEIYYDHMYETVLMRRFRGGGMITKIRDNFNAVREKSSAGKKVVILSTHDVNILTLVTLLDVKSQAPITSAYGDVVAIELHQTGNAEPEVKVFYISNTLPFKFKIQLYMNSCGRPCKQNTFNSLMAQYIVSANWFKDSCQL